MLRGFFVGALVGFFFGSSKQGMQIREGLDGLLPDLLSNRGEEEEPKPAREPIRGKFGKQNAGNAARGDGRNARGVETSVDGGDTNARGANGDRPSAKPESSETKPEGSEQQPAGELPMDKAVELAEALSAKPTPPPSDELEPGEHAVGM